MDISKAVEKQPRNVCLSCRGLDFEQIFASREVLETGTEITTKGKRPLNFESLSCDLCRFFHKMGPSYLRNYSQHVRLFDRIKRPRRINPTATRDIPCRHFLSVLRKNAKLVYDYQIEIEIKQGGVVGYIPYENPTGYEIRCVNADAIDYEFIRGQLHNCIDQHPLCRRNNNTTPVLSYIFLIDCIQGRVIKCSPNEEYLTLSYVWGKQQFNFESEGLHSFSLDMAPLTVRDAVQVVKSLRRKYIWVDRYCIDQNNAAEKEMMIQNMDSIYENAEATIVALFGEDDQSGLPGVSSIGRTQQPSFETRSGRLISSFPTITSLTASTKWNTRGWTYQEARLSRRCLFFSEFQVYIVCQQSTWSEAVPFDPSSDSLAGLLNSSRLNGALFGADTSISNGLFHDRLEYSKRNLTYERDILNAFRGILHRSSFVTFWGIPVISSSSDVDPNVGFALGFLWIKRPKWTTSRHIRTTYRAVASTRRYGFPTWSWIGLLAEIYQDNYGLQSSYGQYINGGRVEFPQNEAQIQFWIHIGGSAMSLQDAMSMENSMTLPEQSQQLLVEGDFISHRRKSQSNRKNGGTMHEWYYLCGSWKYFEPDLFDGEQLPGAGAPLEDEIEALVLIQWNESQKPSMKRVLLMLVKWIDEDHAERRGVLTNYRDEFRANLIQKIPKTRKRFLLQ